LQEEEDQREFSLLAIEDEDGWMNGLSARGGSIYSSCGLQEGGGVGGASPWKQGEKAGWFEAGDGGIGCAAGWGAMRCVQVK